MNKKQKLYESRVKDIFFEILSKNFPVTFYWMDKDGIFRGCNEKELHDLHLPNLEAFVGKHATEIVTQEAWQNSLQVMQSKKPLIVEEKHTFPDGQSIYYLSIKTPILNDQGEAEGLLGISIDITQRKQMEEDLKKAKERAEKANDLKTQFIQNMEHDIRTPFTGICGVLDMLLRKESDQEKQTLLQEVRGAAHQLLELLNSILDFDRLQKYHDPVVFKKFDLRELIEKIIATEHPAAIAKNLDFTASCSKAVPKMVVGDEHHLFRILLNLVSNAIKFTPKGFVKIIVQLAKRMDEQRILLRFIVQDTGIGIPKEKQDIIWEQFSRLSPSNKGMYSGRGLGLTIVKQFVTELGGEIELESELGKGSTFSCLLPFKVPLMDRSDDPSIQEVPAPMSGQLTHDQKQPESVTIDYQGKLKILLVEDDLLAQKVATSLLETDCGCEVEVAQTGKEAIKAAKLKNYHLILMDLGLPDMSGFEVAKKLRALNYTLPIVALTAHQAASIQKQTLEAGMNDFITKPITSAQAKLVLDKWCFKKEDKRLSKTRKEKVKRSQAPLTKRRVNHPVIDLKLGARLVGGKKDFALNMLKMLIEELPETTKSITLAYQSKNIKLLGDLVHKLHGGVSYCGVPKLQMASTDLEVAIKANATKKVTVLYQQLVQEIHAVMNAYRKIKKSN